MYMQRAGKVDYVGVSSLSGISIACPH